MQAIFNIVAVPFGYIMRFIYDLVGNYGIAIILFSLLTKILMVPMGYKQKISSIRTARLQPKLQELQRRYAHDKNRYNQEMQALYEREGVSPMAGCGTLLLTFPIMIGLYYVIQKPLTYLMHLTADEIAMLSQRFNFESAYEITLAQVINDNFAEASALCSKLIPMKFDFFGIDLSATPSFKEFNLLWLIPIVSGLTAYLLSVVNVKLQEKMSRVKQPAQGNLVMKLMSPAMSLYFAFILPAGLGLYWIAGNIFSMLQEALLTLYLMKYPPAELQPPKKKKPRPKPVESEDADE